MRRARAKKKANDEDADGLSPPQRVCSLLRDIQWQTNCSTLSLQRFLDGLRGELGHAIKECQDKGFALPRSVESADQKMRDAVCLVTRLYSSSVVRKLLLKHT